MINMILAFAATAVSLAGEVSVVFSSRVQPLGESRLRLERTYDRLCLPPLPTPSNTCPPSSPEPLRDGFGRKKANLCPDPPGGCFASALTSMKQKNSSTSDLQWVCPQHWQVGLSQFAQALDKTSAPGEKENLQEDLPIAEEKISP